MMEENTSLKNDMSTVVHNTVDVLTVEVDATDMSLLDDALSFMAGTHGGVILRAIYSLLPFVTVYTINSTGVDAVDMPISHDVLSFMTCTYGGVTLWAILSLLPLVAVCTINSTVKIEVDALLKKIYYTHNYTKRRMMEENSPLLEDMSTIVHTAIDVLSLEVDEVDMSISDDVLLFMVGTRGGVTLRAIQSILPFVSVCTINSTGDFTYSAIFRLFVRLLIFQIVYNFFEGTADMHALYVPMHVHYPQLLWVRS
ncbi:uncharacterized protein A4U43_C06F13690 [Asparagus officinalis]|uniref:Uncharacterized protein n=1 Tax=Asparagus officinalis TaxID=4686 RepID=A0A5P1ELQ4_ASPOF|nr:uncharacterized protein A4U43_C06F13690 [Asparagus officinalis]